ncbi:hypothetical protein H0H87_006955 [Tephrocybe sp. NHM501043]|nr:hypothetical protein H0H87_006955 [Tephrocybe sp. NHM501043]
MKPTRISQTDALRRHQKSRHNGIVIEPSEKDDAEDDGSSGTRSKSRSATPSSKGKEKEHPLPAPYAAPVTTRTGPSSYYRQHTLTTSPYVPRQVSMGPNYAQSGLPTSATRLNLATHWGYPHPWPDGATAPQQISYQHMYYASHYRPNGSTQPPGSIPPPPPPYSNVTQQHLPPAPCSPPGTQDTKHPTSTDITNNASVSAPSIDPSLDANESTELTPEQIMQITKALLQEQGELESSSAESRDDSTSTTAFSETDRRTGSGSQDERDANEGKAHAIHGYGLPLERPEPMEHMLTEDGEPMLNPGMLAWLLS